DEDNEDEGNEDEDISFKKNTFQSYIRTWKTKTKAMKRGYFIQKECVSIIYTDMEDEDEGNEDEESEINEDF
ncbi:hypothetical protein SNEBB_003097, partial [Seison nebaliae]